MELHFSQKPQQRIFWARSSYAEKDVLKTAGFRWHPANKVWWTTDPTIAARVRPHAEVAPEAAAALDHAEDTKLASRAVTAEISVPAPEGCEYLPYQKAGIAYLLGLIAAGYSGGLIGDEMGLGKTIQAIGLANARPDLKTVLVVCPASLRTNWQREIARWDVHGRTITQADKKQTQSQGWTVVNYDRLHRAGFEWVLSAQWDLIIYDESQYIKNHKAKRTKSALAIPAGFRLFLTGTPILNRPVELWTTVHACNPTVFASRSQYVRRYCAAHQTKWGWDESGSSNLDELQTKLRSNLMVRRLKVDVLKELPEKRRQIIELDTNGATAIVKREQAAWKKVVEEYGYEEAVRRLRSGGGIQFEEISSLRHELGVAKIDHALEHVLSALEDGRQLVVFAHHKDVISGLKEGLAGAGISVVTVTGATNLDARQNAVDNFQAGRARVFLGNIKAAGVGLTLTAASHVIFVESDWTPGWMQQAEDRCHRIGQHHPVLVQILVFDGTLDAHLAKTVLEKQEVIDSALDVEGEDEDEVGKAVTFAAEKVSEVERKQAERVKNVDEVGILAQNGLTIEQVRALHQCLRILAGSDYDRATEINGVGFNKLDSEFGQNLAWQPGLSVKQALAARRMVQKYHRQLPTEIYNTAMGA